MYYLDSGCFKHMINDKSKFSYLTLKSKGLVTYVHKNKGSIICIGNVGTPSFTKIDDVLYVEGFKHNLIIISQLCNKGLNINFNKDECIIEDEISHEINLVENITNNIFMISLDDLSLKLTCLMVNKNNDACV